MKLKLHLRWIPVIMWMGLIFWFSSQSGEQSGTTSFFVVDILRSIGVNIEEFIPGLDMHFAIRKLAHFSVFFVLGSLLFYAYIKYFSLWKTCLYSLITGFVYACFDELHQYFVPGRGPSFIDVLIDTTGIVLALIIIISTYKLKEYLNKNKTREI